MAYLVHNERTKYTATWLNTASIGCLVVGVITPLGDLLRDDSVIPIRTLVVTLIWLALSFARHWGVRALLGRLRE